MSGRWLGRLAEPGATVDLTDAVRAAARPLRDDGDLDPLLARIGDARLVLLGEASHGTAEFYEWRARLSKRLVREKGFRFLAVEGDWPDCWRVNRYLKGRADAAPTAAAALAGFTRWPTWMWANRETLDLATWLRAHDAAQPEARRVGFYGLDVYSLWDSLHAVVRYTEKHRPDAATAARKVLHCFEPFRDDSVEYARASRWLPETCERDVLRLLRKLRTGAGTVGAEDGLEARFCADQNALVIKNAEAYYRAMLHGSSESWNVRDRHMAETLDRLLAMHGPGAKAIVWAHNTHIGDARYTDMVDDGMVSLGQLARERHGEKDVVLIGFSTYRGRVIAGREWEAPMQELPVPAGRSGSWEGVLHEACGGDALLVLDETCRTDGFLQPRGHRAIGVVYRPEREALGNYVPTVLPRRYDALLHLETTEAVHPLVTPPSPDKELPDTFPTAM